MSGFLKQQQFFIPKLPNRAECTESQLKSLQKFTGCIHFVYVPALHTVPLQMENFSSVVKEQSTTLLATQNRQTKGWP